MNGLAYRTNKSTINVENREEETNKSRSIQNRCKNILLNTADSLFFQPLPHQSTSLHYILCLLVLFVITLYIKTSRKATSHHGRYWERTCNFLFFFHLFLYTCVVRMLR